MFKPVPRRAFMNLALALGPAAVLLSAAPAQAQSADAYPTKVVRMVVPLAAGGGVDSVARRLSEKMVAAFGGRSVIVENRPGASGTLGLDAVAKAAPDGYTLTLTAGSAIVVNPHVYKRLPYQTDRDLAPVAQIGTTPLVLLVNASSPFKDLKEFIAFAKAAPKEANFGSYGNATVGHLLGEALNKAADIRLLHVPYKGAAPAISDLIGGQVKAVIADFGSARAHIGPGGRLRALALSGDHRLKAFPDVPTFTEQGFKSLEQMNGWLGVFVPAKTPPEIINKLATTIDGALKADDLRASLAELGYEATGTSGEAFAKIVRDDTRRWGEVITAIGGITLD